MSDQAGRTGEALPTGARVGVVDGGDVEDAVAAAGADPVAGAGTDADVAAFVAVGERAVCELARDCPAAPILPVDAGGGFRSVPATAVETAVRRLFAGEWDALAHPVVDVAGRARAVADAALLTEGPARISEYEVRAGGSRVATVRADGVVVALPAGSGGYARAAGGPVVAPGTDVVAVVPVSPFTTDPDHWVLPLERVALTVARDEAAVELLADDRRVGGVEPGVTLALSRTGTARTAVVPESRTSH